MHLLYFILPVIPSAVWLFDAERSFALMFFYILNSFLQAIADADFYATLALRCINQIHLCFLLTVLTLSLAVTSLASTLVLSPCPVFLLHSSIKQAYRH